MRARLLVPLLVFALAAVLALVVPTAASIAQARTQRLQLDRGAALTYVAELAAPVAAGSDASSLQRYLDRFHEVYGESVLVVDATERPLARVGTVDPADPEVAALITDALRDLPQRTVRTVTPWGPDDALLAQPVAGTGSTTAGAVVLRADLRPARGDVSRWWAVLGAVAAGLLVGLGVASQRWTTWVLRPVRALDAAASAFPRRRDLDAVHGGPPELRHLAGSVSRMARGMEELVEQQRGFVADASHQLRNPLAAIQLRIDAGLEDGTTADELRAIAFDVDRLQHIVDRMLALAAAEHRAHVSSLGQEETHSEARREHTVASAAALVEPFRRRVEEAGLSLRAVGGTPVQVACRRSDLEEALENLLDNAVKYAGPGAGVTVTLRRTGEVAEIEVADDGPGLPPDELDQVGTRFWRSRHHGRLPGTGLGLAIVRQLVAADGGELVLTNASPTGLSATLRLRALS